MNDYERAVDALERLTKIEAGGDARDRAVDAVGELVEELDVQETDPTERLEVPEEWDDVDEWAEAVEEAYEEAEIPPSKGTLTTKTIDGRDYYYLQWREGETVTSQYVAPVSPAE